MKTVKVTAALILDDHKVFAARRARGEITGFEFPGGKVEAGESPEEALKREIREELRIQITKLEYFTTIEFDYPSFHLSMDCFFAKLKEKTPVLTEHTESKWLSKDELDTVEWLPADQTLIPLLKAEMQDRL